MTYAETMWTTAREALQRIAKQVEADDAWSAQRDKRVDEVERAIREAAFAGQMSVAIPFAWGEPLVLGAVLGELEKAGYATELREAYFGGSKLVVRWSRQVG